MVPKEGKNEYGGALPDLLHAETDVPPEGDFSLEEILAEYGGSRKQKLLADVEQAAEDGTEKPGPEPGAAQPAPQPEAAPVPGSRTAPAPSAPEGEPQPAPECAPQAGPAPEQTTEPAAPPRRTKGGRRIRTPEQAPAEPAAPEEPPLESILQDLPPAPHPIPLEEVVGRTVDTVMEERKEEILRPRRGLFSRRRYAETEELYAAPKKEAPAPAKPEEETIGPEPPAEDMAAEYRDRWKQGSRPLAAAVLVTLAMVGLTAAAELGPEIPVWSGNLRVQSAVLLAGLALVCVLCRGVFVRGVRALKKHRCSAELLASLSALVSAADCAARPFLSGRSDALPYAAVACAGLVFALWGGVREDRGQYDAYRMASDPEPPYLVTDTPKGACKQAGTMRGFCTDAEQPPLPRVWQTALLPVVLAGGLVFALLASAGQQRREDFLLCWSAILTASCAFGLPLSWGLPWSRLARQLQKNGCAVAGWGGAEKIGARREIILTDMDLFPPGAMRLNGVKVYGEELRSAASYAASLAAASGSGGLIRLFDGLVRSEGGEVRPVDDFSFYEEGGVSASIRGESVLMGTASFMRKMDVRLPGNLNLHTGVYLAVERQLTAVFAVKYEASENVDWALRMLRRNRLDPILATRDANITPSLLHRKFNRRIRAEYPPLSVRVALSEQEGGSGRPRALLYREGLAPYAETVAGGRRLARSSRRCALLSLLGSISGTLLAFYLSYAGAFTLLTPLSVLAFGLLWLLPVLVLSDWTGRL